MLDHVVDFLHDKKYELSKCCLVSKSWIPRTRTHLFADIKFRTEKDLQSWKKMFPDPSTSPAHYAKTLSVKCLQVVTAADAEPGGWIGGFSRVVHFTLDGRWAYIDESATHLVQFYGFSPVVKSLNMTFTVPPFSQMFNLIRSLPLLEDLTVVTYHDASAYTGNYADGPLTITQPSSPLMFTGSLELRMRRDETYDPSIVVPTRRYPLPEAHFGVV
jgi:hypothetical protein